MRIICLPLIYVSQNLHHLVTGAFLAGQQNFQYQASQKIMFGIQVYLINECTIM